MIHDNDIQKILDNPQVSDEIKNNIRRDLEVIRTIDTKDERHMHAFFSLLDFNDYRQLMRRAVPRSPHFSSLKTLDELLEKDKKREKDGFPKKIRIGKILKPTKDKKGKVVVVPTTTEPKFLHDESVTEEQEGESTGGSGEGEEGEVIGEQPIRPQEGEGEGKKKKKKRSCI